MKFLLIIVGLVCSISLSFGQDIRSNEYDKCGYDTAQVRAMSEMLGDHWGYSYDSLLNDLSSWGASNYVQVNSIGQSTQNREIYELTITDPDPVKTAKHRIYIHARTHPNEVQSFWVTDEIINYLIAESPIGTYLRERCIFHIVPMYNPDGVELEKARENANDVDIESNWSAATPEIEVVHLRSRLSDLMLETNPIEVALNMHSAFVCKRYFVYHHENGTSPYFADLEEDFIESVRSHFYSGIEPYTYYQSWTSSTPSQYPESWWWMNFGESVMALTYEDMNCADAGFYDKTAFAILHGISDYLNLGFVGVDELLATNKLNVKAYPNPFSAELQIEWNSFQEAEQALIRDIYGRVIRTFSSFETENGQLSWDGTNDNGSNVAAGTYVVQLVFEQQVASQKIVKY